MVSKCKRTLIVREIKNLTEETMYVYGTSGSLTRLEPEDLSLVFTRRMPEPEPNTAYVADGIVLEVLNADKEYEKVTVRAKYVGRGCAGEPIYRFYDKNDTQVIPVTDDTNLGFLGYKSS